MALGIYAGSSVADMAILPSPVELVTSREIIWSEDTGRAQSGENKAKMIGSVVDTKETYAIKWGVITQSEMSSIRSKLTAGFFYFGVGTTLDNAKSVAKKYYRSEITGDYLPIGNTLYFKDVGVSVIEQ